MSTKYCLAKIKMLKKGTSTTWNMGRVGDDECDKWIWNPLLKLF